MPLPRMTLKTPIAALVALTALGLPAAADEPSLESRLMPLIQAHKGKVAVAVKNLKTGEAYRQAAEKAVDLGATVTLKASDKVPGSGILTDHFSEGASFPLVDAVHLM